ncbi:hypothetical protein CV632_09950 [Geobacillus thermodenitrificans]|jgi:hypothetical protein|nr:hypothetical protein GD3902_00495 [Geobacillus thermodenitrificans]PJW20810.1 hypothetical protein CV632_09950 [Geobacillus thermodenitrificans]
MEPTFDKQRMGRRENAYRLYSPGAKRAAGDVLTTKQAQKEWIKTSVEMKKRSARTKRQTTCAPTAMKAVDLIAHETGGSISKSHEELVLPIRLVEEMNVHPNDPSSLCVRIRKGASLVSTKHLFLAYRNE